MGKLMKPRFYDILLLYRFLRRQKRMGNDINKSSNEKKKDWAKGIY